MILECPLDDLVEEIGRQKFMNICSWKVMCKWLYNGIRRAMNKRRAQYHDIVNYAILIPHLLRGLCFKNSKGMDMAVSSGKSVEVILVGRAPGYQNQHQKLECHPEA